MNMSNNESKSESNESENDESENNESENDESENDERDERRDKSNKSTSRGMKINHENQIMIETYLSWQLQ
jgi:hypothetical protein